MKSSVGADRVTAAKEAARRALGGLTSGGSAASGYPSHRTEAGRDLPPYHLVYFLLVKLLGFKDMGRHEKVAWSVRVEYKSKRFAIEHRKMGLGIFAHDLKQDEPEAAEIAGMIKLGVRAAEPFFEFLAQEAVKQSKLNVLNRSSDLFERYTYLRDLYRRKNTQAECRKEERQVTEHKTKRGTHTTIHVPYYGLKQEANWLAQSAIEAFFCWSEHAFIHLALLLGRIKTAEEVGDLVDKEWAEKYKCALDLGDPETKRLYDELVEIRRQIRNFLAHGAFGKQGEAFQFHSDAGAVPVLLPHQAGKRKYSMTRELSFKEDEALAVIEEFIAHLWAGPRAPAHVHVQEEQLPTILTMVADGTYLRAMSSLDAMADHVSYINHYMDQAIDMDW